MSRVRILIAAAFFILLTRQSAAHSTNIRSATLDVKAIASAVDMYQIKHGQLPDTLQALVPREIKEIRSDPWGDDFVYLRSGNDFEIRSAGPDGVPGTADDYSSNTPEQKPRSGCAW